jgi:ABC-type transport system involved in multi-copper enzyme maturation permease subunit
MPLQRSISRLATPLRANALLERLVRTGSRRKRHQLARSLFLGILVATTALSVLLTTSLGGQIAQRSLAVGGAGIFELVAFIEIAAICILTPIFMAGSIAQEASPRTWDILLTTPMRAPGIVLGNLLGRVIFVLALIVAGLPILLSLQFFGGVQPRSVLAATVIAAATAMVVGAAAVMLSATRTGGRRAVLGYFAGVIIALAATAVADQLLQQSAVGIAGATTTTIATPLNPFLTLRAVLQPGQIIAMAPPHAGSLARFWLGSPVWAFLAASGLATVVMLSWATLRVRLLGPIMGGGGVQTSGRKHRPIGRHPIAWRAASGRPQSVIDNVARWAWGGLCVAAVAVVLLLGGMPRFSPSITAVLLEAILMVQIGVAVLAAVTISGAAVTTDREQGTLDLLLTTPIQPGPYLWGKLLGIAGSLLPLLLAPIVSLGIIAIVAAASTPGQLLPADTNGLAEVGWGGLLGLAISLVPFLGFCIAIGLQWSLRCRGSIAAVSIATVICLLIVAAVGLCATPVSRTPILGPFVVAMSPGPSLLSAFKPDVWVGPMAGITASMQLLVAGILAAIAWSVLTWMMLRTTMRTFIFTMRRLAGTH